MTTPECSNNNADYNQPLHQIFVQENNRLDFKSHSSTLSSVDDSSINFARAAVLNDDRITVKKLLETDLHILNYVDILGRTLLIYAASSNKLKMVKHLIKRGANIDFCDKCGRSSLYWAVHCDHVEVVKLLLHNSADYTLTDENGVSPLHESVKLSSTKCLKVLLETIFKKHNAFQSPFIDAQGRSVVHWAALLCHLEHLQLLIKTPQLSRFIDQRDDGGRTPLMLAASSNSSDSLACCQFLVQKAHYVVRAQDKEGLSIIHHSCAVNNSQVLNWLLDSVLFDTDSSLDLNYRTALHWACKSNSVECVDLLLEKGAKLQGDKTGHSPLHYVARENLHILADKLLRHFKSDDLLDSCGTTALMQAVMAGSMDVVETFFRLTTVDKDGRDYENRSLLHLAARRGQCSTLQFLLNEKLRLEAVDIHGLTPFLSAVECGQVRCVQILLKAGADASKCDRHGRTALHWAALGGHAYLCQLLIKHGLNPDYADSGGRTPLHCAAFAGHSDCASILIHCGATTIWLPDNDGFSVLHTAAEQGHIKTMKILIEDANLAVNTVCTIDGGELTPLDCAMLSKKSTSAVDFLISLGGLTYEALANAAATKIQSTFRSYRVRKMFRHFYRPSKSVD